MLLRIYKAFVRGAHLTTQKNSPRFAMSFTSMQKGFFWSQIAVPISFFVSVWMFDSYDLIIPFFIILGGIIFLMLRLIKLDESDFYPNRENLSSKQIKKEVAIYNIIAIVMILLSVFSVYFIIKK
ncbi:MAG: hypothetical protein KKE30_13515 [Gammaproteobacteria bacterium]|nr:hypothetical protein [Gammaproteobacteria bacterium]MBU1553829.1 hypothetical protein [Gammaproteobacteria bacterium]MBU2070511.1 hypothetical protein [Gammaproteobacteria bacterium]MBU2185312.1 hypothetical protein [Gammaproteobacteria bacterium]MBU2203215.1 hypothetical protein [Gammaproteobacteria bacterium]